MSSAFGRYLYVSLCEEGLVMQVMVGKSYENADGSWSKVEIRLDESDLQRLEGLYKFKTVTTGQVFEVLLFEAERLQNVTMTRRGMGDNSENRKKLFEALVSKLAVT